MSIGVAESVHEHALARLLGVPRVVHLQSVPSTMDIVHGLGAEGAASGTVVIADEQTAGRGRNGRPWQSARARGLWLSVLERPPDASGLDVLSLRLGLRLSEGLAPFAAGPISVKWPNDLLIGARKLAGILVEARWRAGTPEWVCIGIGINLEVPAELLAAALRTDAPPEEVLLAVVTAARAAALERGPLSQAELDAFERRDAARGRRCAAPATGVVQGISSDGALVIATPSGLEQFRAGSLEFAGGPT